MDAKPSADGSQAQHPSYLMTSLVSHMISCYYFSECLRLREYDNGEQENGKGF